MSTPLTVLLLEDNPVNALIIEHFVLKMKEPSFRLIRRTRLKEGLILLPGEISLVLLDLELLDSEGFDTFLRVQAAAPDLPILVLTDTDDEELALRAVQAGAQDYLVKGQLDLGLLKRAMRYSLERKRTERKIKETKEQLRELSRELAIAEEREQRRIARELHDQVGQLLAVAKLNLKGIEARTEEKAGFLEVHQLLDQAIQFTRTLTCDLSPPVLYELGLGPAIEWLIEKHQGFQISFEDDRNSKPLEADTRGLLFRGVRELLINLAKHSRSANARIRYYREDGCVRISVEDDGVGFDPSQLSILSDRNESFGLFSLQERLIHIGGDLRIDSSRGMGSTLTLSVPCRPERTPR